MRKIFMALEDVIGAPTFKYRTDLEQGVKTEIGTKCLIKFDN